MLSIKMLIQVETIRINNLDLNVRIEGHKSRRYDRFKSIEEQDGVP